MVSTSSSPTIKWSAVGFFAAKALSMNPDFSPRISAWLRGRSRTTSIRPASESATFGIVIRLADPVRRNLPAVLSSSTVFLMASSRSGARWISSITARSKPRTKPTGSSIADRRTVASSNVRKGVLSEAMSVARVVLPDCRGPEMRTTRVSDSASSILVFANLGYKLGSTFLDRLKVHSRPIESQPSTI